MAKIKEVNSSEEFISYRRSLKKIARTRAFLAALAIVIVYALYVFFAIATNGYLDKPAFTWAAKWGFKFPYFDTTVPLTNLTNRNVLGRYALGIVVIIIALIVFYIIYRVQSNALMDRSSVVQSETIRKILDEQYGIKVDKPHKNYTNYNSVFKYLNVTEVEMKNTTIFTSELISFDAIEYIYVSDKMERNGLLAVTEVVEPKVNGFIQFRSFSTLPEGLKYKDKEIRKIAITNENIIGKYAVYSNMNENDVNAFITPSLTDKLLHLLSFIPSKAIAITIADGELSIFIDGMETDYLLDLDKRITMDYIEKQAYSFKLLHDVFAEFTYESTAADLSGFTAQLGTEEQY